MPALIRLLRSAADILPEDFFLAAGLRRLAARRFFGDAGFLRLRVRAALRAAALRFAALRLRVAAAFFPAARRFAALMPGLRFLRLVAARFALRRAGFLFVAMGFDFFLAFAGLRLARELRVVFFAAAFFFTTRLLTTLFFGVALRAPARSAGRRFAAAFRLTFFRRLGPAGFTYIIGTGFSFVETRDSECVV